MNNKSPGLQPVKTAAALLDMYYLDTRSALLEVAATLDRVERAEGGDNMQEDRRIQDLQAGLAILLDGEGQRVERFLQLLSEEGDA